MLTGVKNERIVACTLTLLLVCCGEQDLPVGSLASRVFRESTSGGPSLTIVLAPGRGVSSFFKVGTLAPAVPGMSRADARFAWGEPASTRSDGIGSYFELFSTREGVVEIGQEYATGGYGETPSRTDPCLYFSPAERSLEHWVTPEYAGIVSLTDLAVTVVNAPGSERPEGVTCSVRERKVERCRWTRVQR